MRLFLLSFLVSISLASCSSYQYVNSAPPTGERVDINKIYVFQSREQVPVEAKQIGFFIARSNKEYKVWRIAKERASANGANGILMTRAEEISSAQKFGNAMIGTGYRGKYRIEFYKIPIKK